MLVSSFKNYCSKQTMKAYGIVLNLMLSSWIWVNLVFKHKFLLSISFLLLLFLWVSEFILGDRGHILEEKLWDQEILWDRPLVETVQNEAAFMWAVLGVDFGTEAAPVISVKISTSSFFCLLLFWNVHWKGNVSWQWSGTETSEIHGFLVLRA